MSRTICGAVVALALTSFPALGQTIDSAYTKFDAEKTCRHKPGTAEEDYGSWRCAGFQGIGVYLSAGDQRMQVSFGPKPQDQPAASQTFPAFNNIYNGTVEWRFEKTVGSPGTELEFAL